MRVQAQIEILAPIEKVYKMFADIEHLAERIPGIIKVEILSDKKKGVGVRWRETRTMFGKEASEEMQMIDAKTNEQYIVEAESRGTHYLSTYTFTQKEGVTTVNMTFDSQAKSVGAKLMLPLGFLGKGMIKKMLLADMQALKEILES